MELHVSNSGTALKKKNTARIILRIAFIIHVWFPSALNADFYLSLLNFRNYMFYQINDNEINVAISPL